MHLEYLFIDMRLFGWAQDKFHNIPQDKNRLLGGDYVSRRFRGLEEACNPLICLHPMVSHPGVGHTVGGLCSNGRTQHPVTVTFSVE